MGRPAGHGDCGTTAFSRDPNLVWSGQLLDENVHVTSLPKDIVRPEQAPAVNYHLLDYRDRVIAVRLHYCCNLSMPACGPINFLRNGY
jgi:hypothetical protein